MDDTYTFVWRIENFSYCFPRTGDSMKSPTFSCGESHFMQWSMRLFPRGRRKADRIDVRLEREDGEDLDPQVEFALLDAAGRPAHRAQRAPGVAAYSVPREEVLRRRLTCLPDDVLTVRARLWPSHSPDRLTVVATTVVRVERWTLPLKVEGFSEFEKDVEYVTSVSAACKDCPGFKIRLCPERDGDNFVSIRIGEKSKDKENLVRCRVSLLAHNDSVVAAVEDEQWFHRYRFKLPWNFPPFISRDSLFKNKLTLLPKDTLSLKIEMNVSLGEWKTTGPKPAKTASESTSVQTEPIPSGPTLQSDLKSLYLDKTLCDFTLTVGSSKAFSVHKSLLAARSPVFKAMFLKEMVKDSLTIRDTDPETMERFLNFAYGEELEDLDFQSYVKLYTAADKYHLLPLKEACKGRLKTALDASNAWDLLLLADRHQDEDLRKTVHPFILEREKSIMALEEEGEALLNLHEVYLKLSPASKTASNV